MAYRKTCERLKQLLQTFSCDTAVNLAQMKGVGKIKVRNIMKAREEYGGKLGITHLLQCGVGPALLSSITQDPLAAEVTNCVLYYQRLTQGSLGLKIDSVVSMDLGVINSAFVHLGSGTRVLSWSHLHLQMPRPYSPELCYREVENVLRTLPSASAYCLELQTHRRASKNHTGFLGISVHLRVLEAMLYGTMRASFRDHCVLCVSPKAVAQYFNLCARGRAKKKAAVDAVISYINAQALTPMGHQVVVPSDLAEYFFLRTKKDDLCDCLLQAIAISEWSEMNQWLGSTQPYSLAQI